MKKLITIVLILAMLASIFSAAAEITDEEYKDPIVGYWYILFNKEDLPESMQKELDKGYYTSSMISEITIYRITEDGKIFQIYGHFEGGYADAHGGNICGTWFKNDESEYVATIVSKGTGIVDFEDDKMYVIFGNNNLFAFHKMETFNIETDIKKSK